MMRDTVGRPMEILLIEDDLEDAGFEPCAEAFDLPRTERTSVWSATPRLAAAPAPVARTVIAPAEATCHCARAPGFALDGGDGGARRARFGRLALRRRVTR